MAVFSQAGCKHLVAYNLDIGDECVGVDMTDGQGLSIRCSPTLSLSSPATLSLQHRPWYLAL